MNYEVAVDELVAKIANNIEADLERAIRSELTDRVLPIVNAAAARIAARLKTRVVAFKRAEDDRLVITIKIDGVAAGQSERMGT